jgi:hypothetical protein
MITAVNRKWQKENDFGHYEGRTRDLGVISTTYDDLVYEDLTVEWNNLRSNQLS